MRRLLRKRWSLICVNATTGKFYSRWDDYLFWSTAERVARKLNREHAESMRLRGQRPRLEYCVVSTDTSDAYADEFTNDWRRRVAA